jgi:hypothetical protein
VISVQDVGEQDTTGSLAVWRAGFHRCLTRRADAMFELADAVASAPGRVGSLPGLSLEPEFRRGHGSVYAALARGRIDQARLRKLLLATVPAGRDGLVWLAGDVSSWARPEAVCSPQRLMIGSAQGLVDTSPVRLRPCLEGCHRAQALPPRVP